METYTKCEDCGKDILSFSPWCTDCVMDMTNENWLNMRNLLRDLVHVLDAYEGKESFANQGQAMDGFAALSNFLSLAQSARKTFSSKQKSSMEVVA